MMHKITNPCLRLLSLLLLVVPVSATAQFRQPLGFSMVNARNHPELEWKSAETRHFVIHWPAHLEGIAYEAAAIAEATYTALSTMLEVQFDHPIRIYLSDEDEIMNGFAVPFPRAYTNIWVNLNQVAEGWSGPEKWLRTVLAHELAHIFHFEAVKPSFRLPGILGIAPFLPVPWTEGIAQYLTEPWHALRGDELLRRAFYDGRPSYTDGASVRNTSLMYASGNAQLRFFSHAYGDSLLPRILAHRQELLGGLIRFHRFNKAFEEVTGQPFSDFEDEWRRHMAIYYHSLASQMERSDSLDARPEKMPALFVGDVSYSPDTSMIAVLGLVSAERPFQRLWVLTNDSIRKQEVLAEGQIQAPVAWCPQGERLAYAATVRGAHGSLLNDLYLVGLHTGESQRLTHSRRAMYPAFAPGGEGLYYVVNEQGCGNVFFRSLSHGEEIRITQHRGDVQIGRLSVHPEGTHLAFARFEADGSRHLVVLELESGHERVLTLGKHDDRYPVWVPDGRFLAYTSLRDGVPNVFLIDPFTEEPGEARITFQFAGATAMQWLPPDSLYPEGRLLIHSSDTKRDNQVYLIDAARRHKGGDISLPEPYKAWLTHQPPQLIPSFVAADPSLLLDKPVPYNSWGNISHAATLPFPYYSSQDDFGLGVVSLFSEPLSKHLLSVVAAVSFTEPSRNSLVYLGYQNNQFRSGIGLNLYHNSFTGRFFGSDYLITTNTGGYLLWTLPLEWSDSPFFQATAHGRLRYEYTNANRFWDGGEAGDDFGLPEDGWQQDLRAGLRMGSQKPYRHALIHPLDGWGVEARLTMATRRLGGETAYVRPDLLAYALLPGGGMNRFYLYGRAIAQWGTSFNQDYIGLGRYDDVQFGDLLPGFDFLYQDAERVRGYREYAVGNRLLFASLEYRLPLLDDLDTRLLGLFTLGRTTLTAFLDGGVVWSDDLVPGHSAISRSGTGLELKNVLQVAGLQLVHSLGVARPVRQLGSADASEVYYRIRAVVPF